MKESSVNGYRKDFRAFAKFRGAPSAEDALWALFRLTNAEAALKVLEYQDAMMAAKIAPATIARRVAALHRAVRRGRMVGLTQLTLETETAHAEAFRDVRGPGASRLAQATRPGRGRGRQRKDPDGQESGYRALAS